MLYYIVYGRNGLCWHEYLLQKYRWLILANQSNIKYHTDPLVDSHFHVLINTFDYEDALLRIDSKLR